MLFCVNNSKVEHRYFKLFTLGDYLMQYIVFDLEMNQDLTSIKNIPAHPSKYPFEIIQIGACKLDASFHTIASFNRYVKPTIYPSISPFITDLTGITMSKLLNEPQFHEVYGSFLEFIGPEETIFVTWGMADIRQLFIEAKFHGLDISNLPSTYINIQPFASLHFGLPSKQLLRLQYTIEALNIQATGPYHDAGNDAYYTAEIFKVIYHTFMEPQKYDPDQIISKERKPKKVVDYEGLIAQFEKMFEHKLSKEEQEMIRLAYHMGKTKQFLRESK